MRISLGQREAQAAYLGSRAVTAAYKGAKQFFAASEGGEPYIGPLDLVPGADWKGAYGVIALSAAMRGQNIVRLRRTSDDAEMDFATDLVTGRLSYNDIVTWRDAEGSSDVYVFAWYDQSGNGNHLIDGDENYAVLLSVDTFGDNGGIVFQSAGPGISTIGDITLGNELSVVTVITFDGGNQIKRNLCGINFHAGVVSDDALEVTLGDGGTNSFSIDATSDNFSTEWIVSSDVHTTLYTGNHVTAFGGTPGGTQRFYVDNVSVPCTPGNEVTLSLTGRLNVGNTDAVSFVGGGLQASLGVFLIAASAQSGANLQLLGENLAGHFDVTLP